MEHVSSWLMLPTEYQRQTGEARKPCDRSSMHFAVAEFLSLVKQHAAYVPSCKEKLVGDLQHSSCSEISELPFQGRDQQPAASDSEEGGKEAPGTGSN